MSSKLTNTMEVKYVYAKKAIIFYGQDTKTLNGVFVFRLKATYIPYIRDEKWARKVLHSPRLQKKEEFNFIPIAFDVVDEDKEEK